MNDFYLKKNDRLPVLRSNLQDENGYVDISNSTIQFIYQTRNGLLPPVTGSATIIGATSGYVEYAWVSGETITPGLYLGEWRVTMSGGKQMSFPNDGYLAFDITSCLI